MQLLSIKDKNDVMLLAASENDFLYSTIFFLTQNKTQKITQRTKINKKNKKLQKRTKKEQKEHTLQRTTMLFFCKIRILVQYHKELKRTKKKV